MIARDYNKRITINEYVRTSDGFGGEVTSIDEAEIIDTWAKLVNPSSNRVTDLGLSDVYQSLVFKVRYNGSLINVRDRSLIYNGQEYVINGITDVEMMHREMEIVCTRANPQSI